MENRRVYYHPLPPSSQSPQYRHIHPQFPQQIPQQQSTLQPSHPSQLQIRVRVPSQSQLNTTTIVPNPEFRIRNATTQNPLDLTANAQNPPGFYHLGLPITSEQIILSPYQVPHSLRERNELENKRRSVTNPVTISSEKFNDLVKKNKELGDSNKELREENDRLKDVEEQVNQLQNERDNLSKENQFLMNDVVNLNQQLLEERIRNSKLEAEFQDFQSKAAEEKKALETTLVEVKKVKVEQNFSSQIASQSETKLQKELTEAQSQINSLRSQLDTSISENNELVSKNHTNLNNVNTLKGEIQTEAKKVQCFVIKVQELQEKLSAAAAENVNLQKTVKSLNKDLDDYIEKIPFYETQNDNLCKKEFQLEAEVKNLKEELQSSKDENNRINQSLAHYEAVSKKLGKDLEALQIENQMLMEKLDSLEINKKLDALRSNNKKLFMKVKKLQFEVNQREKDNELLVEKHENEVRELKEELSDFQSSLEDNIKLQRELDYLKKSFSTQRNLQQQELRRENVRLQIAKKSVSDKDVEITRLKEELSEVTALKLEKDLLSRELIQKDEKIEELNAIISNLNANREKSERTKSSDESEQQIIELKATIQNLEEKLEDKRKLLEIATKVHEPIIQKANKEICELKEEAEGKAEHIKKLEEDLNNQKTQVNHYLEQLKISEKYKAQAEAQVVNEQALKNEAIRKSQQQLEMIDELKIKSLVDKGKITELSESKRREIRKLKKEIRHLQRRNGEKHSRSRIHDGREESFEPEYKRARRESQRNPDLGGTKIAKNRGIMDGSGVNVQEYHQDLEEGEVLEKIYNRRERSNRY
ncbi:unnamed protein product [Orchesella dallaii]|uniref:Uncharacterized protein n=1 Tax=Orchesella dallaii TaxID=48710 RepID=A0ABP1RHU7_9HEXA